ncbi:MAG: hypothetical protein IT366_20415 [Candidatus Hydrogenedentes bacterium]|nr:hypothetical protein [Candidatus Hydrogenedentota bacterium]
MRRFQIVPVALIAGVLLAAHHTSAAEIGGPIALHPENPHYFIYRGKPTILITSAEHYGAVLNLDFDYRRYLEELQSHNLNLTRTFSGTYREFPGDFGITDNTLAPKPMRYLAPWARSDTPGASDGGNKYDLNEWDSAYFARLKDFVAEAERRGVVVELTMFCTLYEDAQWEALPMNAANNVNGIGTCSRHEVFKLIHDDLTNVQTAFVSKVVGELKDCNNLIFEVCNEPYLEDCVSHEWQQRVVETIVDEESKLGVRHLISMNIANGRAKVTDPVPGVSVLNFHYAYPPDAVSMNYHHNLVIGENETGFRGKEDILYRTEAWDFLLAGGGLFNSLDWSFMTSHPTGDTVKYDSPGGGSRTLRNQMNILRSFIEGFDFLRMAPGAAFVQDASPDVSVQVFANPGSAYAIYLRIADPKSENKSVAKGWLTITMPEGPYRLQWLNPKTGEAVGDDTIDHKGGGRRIQIPPFEEDVALSIRKS